MWMMPEIYDDLDNKEFLDQVKKETSSKAAWAVQEDAFGLPLAIRCDKQSIKYGFRPPEYKTNWMSIFQLLELDEKINKLYKFSKAKDHIIIKGTFIGGDYPHSDVKKQLAISVQKEIFYSPRNLFYAVDLIVDNKFVNVDKAITLFEKSELFCAWVILSGTLKNCLKHSNKFLTLISRWSGLPTIDNNYCKGVLIKPIKSTFLKNGKRIVIKNHHV